MHIHFIAIGGAAMHNLALALYGPGHKITGSDDEIKDPSRTRLEKAGLLPSEMGWFPDKMEMRPDAVILGMHARSDNPELVRAKELGLKIYSFPEYFYEHSKNKTRLVIGGSHGKTTITAMVMYVLKAAGVDFDYMVGSTVAGFETMVRLSDTAKYIILEGDEYLASPIDRRPKFHLYRPHSAVVSGIAWDHINVFPTFENYVEQFRIFAEMIPPGGSFVYYEEDPELISIASGLPESINKIPYKQPESLIREGVTYILHEGKEYPVQVFGAHNLANLQAAVHICKLAGVGEEDFLNHIAGFTGAARRLELIRNEKNLIIYRDFAHSPSKLKATLEAVRKQFPDWHLIACMELHTFSSLSDNFLEQYAGTMNLADVPVVFYNPETIAHKKLPPLQSDRVKEAFANPSVRVVTNPSELHKMLTANKKDRTVMLMMSSGTFEGLNLSEL